MHYINYYKNLYTPDVLGSMPIIQYINWIKNGFEKETVNKIRTYGKEHQAYNKLKSGRWTVSFNFLFDHKKRNANIIGATGLLMFDLDYGDMVEQNFQITDLNLDDIYIMHKSVGGLGYTVIVKVNGLTLENFKYNYNLLAESLGVSDVMDKNARKATQYTILSFDPDIYINDDSTVFNAVEEPQIVKYNTTTTAIDWDYQLAETSKAYTFTNYQLRYNNLQDYIKDDEDYIFDYQNGYSYVSVPYRYSYPIDEGGRAMHLFTIAVKIAWLNPQADYDTLKDYLFWLNDSCHNPPLPDQEVRKTLRYVLSNKDRLKPIINKKPKKIIFNDKLGWHREMKMQKVYELNAKNKSGISKAKIEAIIEYWDFESEGKITQRAIYRNYEISKKTVEKYWWIYKEEINYLNSTWTTRL